MVQFNLLPDVKQQYAKSVRSKRVINLTSISVGGGFLLIFILMYLHVRVNQTHQLSSLDSKINTGVKRLQSNKDLDKVLTVQNQLSSLPALHSDKIMTSRLFEYLGQMTPNDANVSDVSLDVETQTIVLKGSADTVQTINKFVDTIKFTEYTIANQSAPSAKAYSDVVLQNFNISQGNGASTRVTYEITFKYDEKIFMNTAVDGDAVANSVKLTVPKIITSRSETQKPSDLFTNSSSDIQTGGGAQ